MTDAIDLLRKVGLFTHLTDEQLQVLATQSRELSFRKNAVLMTEGDVGESMYVIRDGLVKVFVSDEDGKELVQAFMQCLMESPEMGVNIIRSLTQRLRQATEGSRSLALDNVYRRLADKLQELAEGEEGEGDTIIPTLPKKFSHQDLGNMIGASREMVGKVMAELVKGEYVELRDGRIALMRKLPRNW